MVCLVFKAEANKIKKGKNCFIRTPPQKNTKKKHKKNTHTHKQSNKPTNKKPKQPQQNNKRQQHKFCLI